MRLLCVGRHAYLSEHLCRYFRDLGADCAAAVGANEARHVAATFEPHVVVCDCDLITPSLLNEWATDPNPAVFTGFSESWCVLDDPNRRTMLPLRQTHQSVAAMNMPSSMATALPSEGADVPTIGDSRDTISTGEIGLTALKTTAEP